MIARRRLLGLLASASALPLLPRAALAAAPLYKDARAPIPDRVRDLLGRMTLEEKVAQLVALWATKADVMDGLTFDPAKASAAYPDGVGAISRASDKRGGPGISAAAGGNAARWRTPAETVAFVNAVQRWALEKTRLGIPVLFHEESLHGYMATEATMFPQAIALAGTFDTDLMRRVQSVIAREVRARGVPYVLSPVVDIVRDPRWGRIEETFGEDAYLCAEMGVAAVEGLQGPGKFDRLAPGKVFATLKHMTGHGQPQGGENIGPAQISERELRENFFPPFRAVVERTAIAAVMPSYNEIDGVPSHANRWLLHDVLRGEWGFDGIVSSDYGAVEELAKFHHVAADLEEAARQALAAGVDSNLPDGVAYRTLADQVRAGKVDIAAVDVAVARILTFKFRADLFDNPYGDVESTNRLTGNVQARALALEAARKALCLLKNDGTLPLKPAGTIAVIGPNAAVARLGGYSSVPKQTVSLLDGIRTRLAGKARVVTAQGVFITQSEDRSADEVTLGNPTENRRLIAEAVETAKGADVIVLAIGDTEQTSREGFAANHLGDRADLDLLAQQNDLFLALAALGKPVVVCAINGRPPSWPTVAERANAILECWYAGQEGGTAIAEALFGDVNPGAKLPVSVVRDAGQIPLFYNHKPSARRGYLFESTAPLFPFGHGLSYTSFAVGKPVISSPSIPRDGQVTVSVEVRNTGARAGDEVVQLYIRHLTPSVTRPVMELKGFRRVTLAPGEARTVTFTLGPEHLRIWNAAMREVVEPGQVAIMVGNSSAAVQSTTLTIA
ncbi:glycoside hydrolase family 3 C-terminal domain-containing protein [Sphingomonas cannabina]|uniref:glycoside hydrolase family 3 N-terminal domain-containing protein n=1 Tax=Sphingomonas cannabina TaxID=2899123 RepID=UPI001F3D318E|nr:glycoside hydrolase family 3 N-terminal domain-containing protein [Sphingomonas cannabina]UIJ44376.1 glycoside hydrolase family 3 C-terminal domain-containing protein [Sphingomonas cannabina]